MQIQGRQKPTSAVRHRCWLLCSLALVPRGSRLAAASFVVAPGRKACPLASPQHGGARSG